MLVSYQDDKCCGNALADALLDGKLDDAKGWVCPECGCEWRPETLEGVRHWQPHDFVKVIR